MSLYTIQITSDENHEIETLKEAFDFPTKKAVVLEGLHLLKESLEEKKRVEQLQTLSLKLRKQSLKVNREWAPFSKAIKAFD